MKKGSKRFNSPQWLEYIVPIVIGILLLSLVIVLVLVAMAVFGFYPVG